MFDRDWGKANELFRDFQEHGSRDRFLREISEAIKEARKPAWLPIDTVPRDNTVILLGWDKSLNMHQDGGGQASEGRWSHIGRIGWVFEWLPEGADLHPDPEPTHWMPLPEPPEV